MSRTAAVPNNSPEQRKREKKNNDSLNQKTKTNSREAFSRSLLDPSGTLSTFPEQKPAIAKPDRS
jgi:hypothetical protein